MTTSRTEAFDAVDVIVAKRDGQVLSDAQIVDRLIDLNQARAEEEALGHVRFLRPVYQAGRVKTGTSVKQAPLSLPRPREKPPLPDEQAVLASTLLSLLRKAGRPLPPAALIDEFDGSRPRARRMIDRTLAVLAVAGSVQQTDAGWFAPRRMPG